MKVNSKPYWDNRFNTDWITNHGKEQSAFFSHIALDNFPEWLVIQINKNQYSICDWGCALGDGTNKLKEFFYENKIIGIDFSDVAIEKAKEAFSDISFISEDLLQNTHNYKYDVLFSSNTLEHFSRPWEVLEQLTNYARQHIILLIPYKEFNKYSEHLYSFDERNIPSSIGEFFLTSMQIINGAKYLPSFWTELQVLIIYSHQTNIKANNIRTISQTDILVIEGLYRQHEILINIKETKETLLDQLGALISKPEIIAAQYKKVLNEKEEIIQGQHNPLETTPVLKVKTLPEQPLSVKETTINGLKNELEKSEQQNNFLQQLVLQSQTKDRLILNLEKELEEVKHEINTNSIINENLKEKELLIKRLEKDLREAHQQITEQKIIEEQLSEKEALIKSIEIKLNLAEREIYSKKIVEAQLAGKQFLIEGLKKSLEQMKNEVNFKKEIEIELQEKKLLIEGLKRDIDKHEQLQTKMHHDMDNMQIHIKKLQQDVAWYKSTFEDRSFWGILKEKTARLTHKK